VKRSTKTINDLLDLARSKPPRRRTARLADVMAGARATADLPDSMQVQIEAPQDLTAAVDTDQFSHVLTNLLLNASQAMDGQGQIWMEAIRGRDRTFIRVRDSGPGVPAELQQRIFEALFTTKARGTGLGLALCRRIAEGHGGTILLEPTAAGASFLITIPDESS
jgi:two-component system, NtrC family, sensor histidine kinase HydH